MIWPFSAIGKNDQRIAKAEIAAAETRTKRYEKLFEIDNLAHANDLESMVRRSLKLLEPRSNND